MLPIFPAMALMVGFLLDRAISFWKDGLFWRRLITWPTNIFLVICVLAGLGLPIYTGWMATDWLPVVLPISVIFMTGAVLSFVFHKRNNGLLAIVTVVGLITGIVTYGTGAVVNKLNDHKSARSFCLNIMDKIQGDETLKMYRSYRPVYAYYTRKRVQDIRNPETLLRHFNSGKRIFFVARESKYHSLKQTFPAEVYVIHRQWVNHRYMYLLSNFPDA